VIVFLIDADNLCVSSWVEEAFVRLEAAEGVISVRRAYGSAEKLKGLSDVMRERAVRPFVNLPLTKNTTDIALAVDAMEFACHVPRPATVIVGSGDADFVPLVVRLRERGIRVVCASAFRKMAPEAISAYDSVLLVGEDQIVQEPPVVIEQAPPIIALRKPVPRKEVAAKNAPAKKVAAKNPVAKKTMALKTSAKKSQSANDKSANSGPKVEVQHILKTVPSLLTGQAHRLGDVVKLLHDAKLLGKNSTSTKLFKKFPHHFELRPSKQPNTVQYILPP
jgi:NYN domain